MNSCALLVRNIFFLREFSNKKNRPKPRKCSQPTRQRAIDWFWKLSWQIHESTLCTKIVLLPVRSQIDLKVPRKLINVTNISICTENRILKSFYWSILWKNSHCYYGFTETNATVLWSQFSLLSLWSPLHLPLSPLMLDDDCHPPFF